MAMSSKVFIYDHAWISEYSRDDLRELLISKNILNSPDVVFSRFNENFCGLLRPTFVVPGGFAPVFAKELKAQFQAIRSQLNENFNYIGVCAGAFVATTETDYYATDHKSSDPTYLFKEENDNLGLVEDYKALGSFYPNVSHSASAPKNIMPYRVELSLAAGRVSQLYIAGPGFASKPAVVNQPSTVVAAYADRDQYAFTNEDCREVIRELPAMIRKFPTEKRGGIFLSGTHIEACVSNSRLLSFFKATTPTSGALSEKDHKQLVEEQEKAKTSIESLLKTTLTLGA